MRRLIGSVTLATAVLAVAAAPGSPARAEVAAGEVLGWCDGANQPGQLGAFNAFRCVNYLQGAAEMAQVLGGVDVDACLGGGQSAGTQLMARFIPQLRARTAAADVNADSVARQVADWIAEQCAVDLPVASADAPAGAPLDTQLQVALAALDDAKAEAEANALQVAALQATLDAAPDDGALQACTISLTDAEARADDNAMRITELELELEAFDAEAMARRQEINAAEQRITALSSEFESALAAKRREIEDAERRIAGLTASLETALRARADAERAVSEARREAARLAAEQSAASADAQGADQRLAAAEQRLSESHAQAAALESALATSRHETEDLRADLRAALDNAAAHLSRVAALESEAAACEIAMVRAEAPRVPPPPLAPQRETSPTVVAAATPAVSAPPPVPSTLNRVDVPSPARSGGSFSNGNAVIPGRSGASISIAADPLPLDTLGLMALRQHQQLALYQNVVGQRRTWATQDGRYSGYVEVLREGYPVASDDFCREIFSVATNGGAVVHQSADMYCQSGSLWVYRR